MRTLCTKTCAAVHPVFWKAVANGRVFYPRYAKFHDFLSLFVKNLVLPLYVTKIVLVSEGLKAHQYGYEWAWENLQNCEGVEYTDKDKEIIDKVNGMHATDLAINGGYLNGGGYRADLSKVFDVLLRLNTIEVRTLKIGEHNPEWDGPKLLKGLSFYREGLNTNPIFYGDWKYDTVHKRVTATFDEFGDEILEPNAGPQASFVDDLLAAMGASNVDAEIKVV